MVTLVNKNNDKSNLSILLLKAHLTKGNKLCRLKQAIARSQGKKVLLENPSFIARVLLSVLLCHGHSDRKERGILTTPVYPH